MIYYTMFCYDCSSKYDERDWPVSKMIVIGAVSKRTVMFKIQTIWELNT